MDAPFRLLAYDKGLRPMFSLPLDTPADVPGVQEVTVRPQLDALPTASVTLPSTHPRAAALHTPGTRFRVWDQDGKPILSGPVTRITARRGASEQGTSTVTFNIEDDRRLLWKVLGWVAPAKPIDQQQSDDSSAQYRLTNLPAETVVKTAFTANAVTRYGLPVTVLPNLSRGQAVTFTSRMKPLADGFFPAVTAAGIQVVIRQEDVGGPRNQRVVLDVVEHRTLRQIYDHQAPQITDWGYTIEGPTATRGVAGGQGQGNARVFKSTVNTVEETAWGPLYAGEIWDDQRQESLAASVQAAIVREVADKASREDLTVDLADTDLWGYGRSWRVGDFVNFRLTPDGRVTKMQVTAAELAWTPTDGYKATTTLGTSGTSVASPQMQVITALARRVRSLETNL